MFTEKENKEINEILKQFKLEFGILAIKEETLNNLSQEIKEIIEKINEIKETESLLIQRLSNTYKIDKEIINKEIIKRLI